MKRKTAVVLSLAACISACSSVSEILTVGNDTYLVSSKTTALGKGHNQAKAMALKKADHFCKVQGKSLVVNSASSSGAAGWTPVEGEIVFRCEANQATVGQASDEELKALRLSLARCHLSKAPALDDQTSDARTIAHAVADACLSESEDLFRAEVRGQPAGRFNSFRAEWKSIPFDAALQTVLKLRAQGREPSRSPKAQEPQGI